MKRFEQLEPETFTSTVLALKRETVIWILIRALEISKSGASLSFDTRMEDEFVCDIALSLCWQRK